MLDVLQVAQAPITTTLLLRLRILCEYEVIHPGLTATGMPKALTAILIESQSLLSLSLARSSNERNTCL